MGNIKIEALTWSTLNRAGTRVLVSMRTSTSRKEKCSKSYNVQLLVKPVDNLFRCLRLSKYRENNFSA